MSDTPTNNKNNKPIIIIGAVIAVLAVIGGIALIKDKVSGDESTSGELIPADSSYNQAVLIPADDDEEAVESNEVPAAEYHVDAVGSSHTSSPESFYNAFMDALTKNDIKFIHENILAEDKTFLSEEDVEYVLRRSHLSHFVGNTITLNITPTFSTQGGVSTVTINPYENNYDVEKYFYLKLVLSDENEWQIDPSNFSETKYYCYTPKGVRFYLNDREVSTAYKTKTENNLDFYEIENIAYRNWDTKLVSSSFGEINGSIAIEMPKLYAYNEKKWIEIPKTLSSELFTEITGQVTDIYNKIYNMIDNGSPAEELNQFICTGKDYKYLEQHYYDAINNYTNTDGSKKLYNIMILEVYQNPSVNSYVFSDDSVVVNVVMDVRWNVSDTNIHNNKVTTAMKVTKEGDKWLLNEIKPNGLSYINGSSSSENVGQW